MECNKFGGNLVEDFWSSVFSLLDEFY